VSVEDQEALLRCRRSRVGYGWVGVLAVRVGGKRGKRGKRGCPLNGEDDGGDENAFKVNLCENRIENSINRDNSQNEIMAIGR
jgi:hypothetical protein